MKKVYIELTDAQKEKLSPLFDEVLKASPTDNPVMLLAQIHIAGLDAVASCGIIPNGMAKKIQAAMNIKTVGKTVGDSHARKLLAKAQKTA